MTADADGRHKGRDVMAVAETLTDDPHSLFLACGDLKGNCRFAATWETLSRVTFCGG